MNMSGNQQTSVYLNRQIVLCKVWLLKHCLFKYRTDRDIVMTDIQRVNSSNQTHLQTIQVSVYDVKQRFYLILCDLLLYLVYDMYKYTNNIHYLHIIFHYLSIFLNVSGNFVILDTSLPQWSPSVISGKLKTLILLSNLKRTIIAYYSNKSFNMILIRIYICNNSD